MNSLKSNLPTKSIKSLKSLFSKNLTTEQINNKLQKCLDKIDLSQKILDIRKDEINCRDKILGSTYWREATDLEGKFPDNHPQLNYSLASRNRAFNTDKIIF